MFAKNVKRYESCYNKKLHGNISMIINQTSVAVYIFIYIYIYIIFIYIYIKYIFSLDN